MAWNDGKFELNGVEWYIAGNVCEAIGVKNTTMAIRGINETYKQKRVLNKEVKAVWIINIKGVIQLLQRSRKDIAMKILKEELNQPIKQVKGTKTRGVYRSLKECKELLQEEDDIVGINILPVMQLYLLKYAVEYPGKASQAYCKWINILIHTDNIKNIAISTRKYMASKKQPKNISLVWIKSFINLGYLREYRIMSADNMVFDLLESQFQEVFDLRYGRKRLYWFGPEPHMFFKRDKLTQWIDNILQTKPFAEGSSKRVISPKNVVQEIIESIGWCRNKMGNVQKSDYWGK